MEALVLLWFVIDFNNDKNYMIKIIDRLLSDEELKKLQDLLLGSEFPWYFNYNTVEAGQDILSDFQMTHTFYREGKNFGYVHSNFFKSIKPILQPIFSKIGLIDLKKLTVDITTSTDWYFGTELSLSLYD
jgi:hypothetical protein